MWTPLVALYQRVRIRFGLRSLCEPAAGVTGALAQLPEVSRELEKIYLSIQPGLETLAKLSSELLKGGHDLINMAVGSETGSVDFDRTVAVLRTPLGFLSRALDEMPLLASDVSVARAAVSASAALEVPIGRALSPLRFMQTMFRVESAALPAESREIFVALAAEIGRIFETVEQNFGNQFDLLARIEASLKDAIESIDRRYREQGETLRAQRTEIEATLARMAGELAANTRRRTELTNASEAFSVSVNSALTAMQTQDIVAQRLQHAVTGLKDAVEALGAAESDPDPMTAARVHTFSRIEIAQLDAVAAELARSETMLKAAVGNVLARMGGFNQQCLLLSEFTHLTVSVDGVVQVLVDSLAALRAMTAETVDMMRACEQTLEPAESAVAALTQTVDQVARGMGRVALNAQIRAVEVADKTGLEVLAAHTAELTRETVRISHELSAGFLETSSRLAAAMARLRVLREEGERALALCDREGASEEAGLHAFRDHALATVRRLDVVLKDARGTSRTLLARCDLSGCAGPIARVRQAVDRLARSAEKFSAAASSSQAAAVERRYTMSGERVIHHRVLRELGADGVAAADVETSPGIELF